MSVLGGGGIEIGPPDSSYELKPRRVVPWSARDMTWSIFWTCVRHPFKRGVLADAYNRYGVKVSAQRCRECGRFTWWTPAFDPEVREFNDVCLADECPSYDPHRDASIFFAPEVGDTNTRTHERRRPDHW